MLNFMLERLGARSMGSNGTSFFKKYFLQWFERVLYLDFYQNYRLLRAFFLAKGTEEFFLMMR